MATKQEDRNKRLEARKAKLEAGLKKIELDKKIAALKAERKAIK